MINLRKEDLAAEDQQILKHMHGLFIKVIHMLSCNGHDHGKATGG